ncbi:MAG: response regulator [Bdellovibrionota bacterium]
MEKKSVLLVEDNDDLRAVAAELLLQEGFVVHLASTGAEVLRFLGLGLSPGCILLDLGLPDMSSAEFLTAFNDIAGASEIPVVLVSGNSEIATWAKRFNTKRTIRKPYGLETLVQVVSELCIGERELAAATSSL